MGGINRNLTGLTNAVTSDRHPARGEHPRIVARHFSFCSIAANADLPPPRGL
jgi:hypothetical protein